jgi:peptidylprolyl isomerase
LLRRLHRPAAALVTALLLVPALAACGGSSDKNSQDSKDSTSASTAGLDAVSFSGEVGKSLTAKWKATVPKPKSTAVKTLVKGTGPKIASGDTVSTYVWIGNGSTKKAAYSDYDNGAPESIPNGQVSGALAKLFENATYGSRVAAVTTAADLLGSASGNAQLGIGANDTLVVVADLVKKAPVSPQPSDSKVHDVPGSKLPAVVLKNGKPTGLSWAGIAKPSLTTPVQRVVLKKGKGATLKGTETVTVNYLGSTYKSAKPFESSFTAKPLTQPLSGLIPGWKIGLTGVKVGSRVLLQIPPALAYGAEGSGSKIPGNATLWFVIDVVKAK